MLDMIPNFFPFLLGIGLAASCGFRIFIPLLCTAIASHFEFIQVNDSMKWLSSLPSIITLSVATVLEVIAYFFPFIDNALDAIGKPVSIAAGSLIAGSTFYPMQESIQWVLPIIAGGGVAGAMHAGTSALRLGSSVSTAGVGNPILSIIETILAVLGSIFTILIPGLAIFIIILIVYLLYKKIQRKKLLKN